MKTSRRDICCFGMFEKDSLWNGYSPSKTEGVYKLSKGTLRTVCEKLCYKKLCLPR